MSEALWRYSLINEYYVDVGNVILTKSEIIDVFVEWSNVSEARSLPSFVSNSMAKPMNS